MENTNSWSHSPTHNTRKRKKRDAARLKTSGIWQSGHWLYFQSNTSDGSWSIVSLHITRISVSSTWCEQGGRGRGQKHQRERQWGTEELWRSHKPKTNVASPTFCQLCLGLRGAPSIHRYTPATAGPHPPHVLGMKSARVPPLKRGLHPRLLQHSCGCGVSHFSHQMTDFSKDGSNADYVIMVSSCIYRLVYFKKFCWCSYFFKVAELFILKVGGATVLHWIQIIRPYEPVMRSFVEKVATMQTGCWKVNQAWPLNKPASKTCSCPIRPALFSK